MKRNLICFLLGIVSFFALNLDVNAASLKEGIYTIKSALANDKVIDVGNYLLGDTIVIEQNLKIKSGDTLCIIFENTNTEFSIYKLNMKK